MKSVLLFEYAITIVAVVVVLYVAPVSNFDIFRKIWILFGRLAQRRTLSVVAVGLFALALRVAMLPKMPVPEPQIHDEFSYLLAADTFASGRLTNPAHPLWTHFESFHINQQPTYASIYPPAQGLVLAAGKVFGGNAFVGVVVSVCLMCAALCWMLQGWLPARWALLGGLIAVIRIALFSYWGNSYWGGAVAAVGGILLLGALPRLLRHKPRLRDALPLGFGVIILANSRPYEGLILCIGVTVAVLPTIFKTRLFSATSLIKPPMLLLFLLLTTAAAMMGYYFWRVTGSPFRMPYQINQETYAMGQALLWQSPKPGLQYRHREMSDLYEAWLEVHVQARSSVQGFLTNTLGKIRDTGTFFLGPLLTLSLVGLPRVLLDKRIRLLIIIGGVAALGLLAETWFHPHYVAPFTGLIYALLLQSMRHLRCSCWRGRPTGLSLVLIIPLVSMVMAVLAIITLPAIPVQDPSFRAWCCVQTGPSERSRLLASLNAQGGRHLVIVQYGPAHDVDTEWVYNEADIDNAQVVFARDMGAAENAALIQYFKDRKVWLLEADDKPPTLKPYP
jgi:hypothetical protein